jgi:putative endonuclease
LSRRAVGVVGENAAAQHLVDQGMKLLDRNWRGTGGELDIVALSERGVLAVVEVKTRTGTTFGPPTLAVTATKYARLRRLAAQWVEAHDHRVGEIRIDIIGVVVSPSGSVLTIEHLEGAYR